MILSNVKEVRKKIEFFNRIGIHYEAVYHYVIRRREQTVEIYDDDFLDDITAGLISFDMQRFMGNKKKIENTEEMGNKKYLAEAEIESSKNETEPWFCRLKKALETADHETILKNLRKKVLQEINLVSCQLSIDG